MENGAVVGITIAALVIVLILAFVLIYAFAPEVLTGYDNDYDNEEGGENIYTSPDSLQTSSSYNAQNYQQLGYGYGTQYEQQLSYRYSSNSPYYMPNSNTYYTYPTYRTSYYSYPTTQSYDYYYQGYNTYPRTVSVRYNQPYYYSYPTGYYYIRDYNYNDRDDDDDDDRDDCKRYGYRSGMYPHYCPDIAQHNRYHREENTRHYREDHLRR